MLITRGYLSRVALLASAMVLLNGCSSSDELSKAIDKRDLKKVEKLVPNTTRIDSRGKNGETVLMFVCTSSRPQLVEEVWRRSGPGVLTEKDLEHQATPLHFAMISGDPSIAKFLIEKGAPIDITDANGESPIFWAVRYDNIDAAKALIGKRARIDHRNDDGYTALDLARICSRKGFIDLLSLRR
jgi:uncharacterized protein